MGEGEKLDRMLAEVITGRPGRVAPPGVTRPGADHPRLRPAG